MESLGDLTQMLPSTELVNSKQYIAERDGISGCIIGCAIGDGFGLATEFMSKAKAKYYYGIGPVAFGSESGFTFLRDNHRGKWHENDFTDDTDQALLIAQCLIDNGGLLNPIHFAYRLKEWTQHGFTELQKPPFGCGFTVRSVLNHTEFLLSPHKAAMQVWDQKGRNLAANGAVMRTAVLGIPFYWDEVKVVENSINAAKVTHADPRSVTSAVVASVIVSRLLLRLTKKEPKKQPATNKVEITRLLLNGSKDDGKEILTMNQSVLKKIIPKIRHGPSTPNSATPFLNQRHAHGMKNWWDRKYNATNMPKKMDNTLLEQRGKVRAPIPDVQLPSIDTFGVDSEMMSLCKAVVDDYKFLLQDNALCPVEPKYDATRRQLKATWLQELENLCCLESLSHLELGESDSIGYTFKCLGAGIFCLTRAIPSGMTSANFFKRVITELTLEGGDADTNGAVAGALLGVRLGKEGLPKEWMSVRHKEFLDKISDNLYTLCQE